MSLYARLAAGLLLALIGTALWWRADRMLAAADQRGYERAQAEYKQRAELQRETNRGAARKAEETHAAQAEARDRFLIITATEVHREAASLAACPIPEPVRMRIRAAAECAAGDRPASCGPDDSVPQAR